MTKGDLVELADIIGANLPRMGTKDAVADAVQKRLEEIKNHGWEKKVEEPTARKPPPTPPRAPGVSADSAGYWARAAGVGSAAAAAVEPSPSGFLTAGEDEGEDDEDDVRSVVPLLFYVSIVGLATPITLPAMSTTTVAQLKDAVHAHVPIPVEAFDLVFGATALILSRMLKSYNIGDGAEIRLVIKPRASGGKRKGWKFDKDGKREAEVAADYKVTKTELIISTGVDAKISLALSDTTVVQLKETLAKKWHLQPSMVELRYNDVPLQDDDGTLLDCGVTNGRDLRVLIKMPRVEALTVSDFKGKFARDVELLQGEPEVFPVGELVELTKQLAATTPKGVLTFGQPHSTDPWIWQAPGQAPTSGEPASSSSGAAAPPPPPPAGEGNDGNSCLLYTSPSPRD